MYQCFPEIIGINARQCQGKQREQMSSSLHVPAGEERRFTVSPPTTHALSYIQLCPTISLTVWKNGRGGLGAFIVSMFIHGRPQLKAHILHSEQVAVFETPVLGQTLQEKLLD